MLSIAPSVQSPRAYDLANLQAAQLLARFTAAEFRIKLASSRYNIREYGADGSGDDTAAIQDCIDDAEEGSCIYIPWVAEGYEFSQLTIEKSLSFIGDGYLCRPNNVFGNAAWNADCTGSLLRSTYTGSGRAITFSHATAVKRLAMERIAVIGPGSGTSIGIGVSTTATATVQNVLRDVLVANFYTGAEFINTYENLFAGFNIRGCTTGFDAPHVSGGGLFSDNHFYRCEVQCCDVGIRLQLATGVSIHGHLFQNNVKALLLQPQAAGGVSMFNLDGECWFENIGGRSIEIDATNGALVNLHFANSRIGEGDIGFVGAETINRLMFSNFSASGQALTIPSNVEHPLLLNSLFASVTDNSAAHRLLDLREEFVRCIGWMRFNGTAGTVTGANNLTLTKNGTGDYTLTFTKAPVDANYVVAVTAQATGIVNNLTHDLASQSSGSFNIKISNPATAALTDTSNINVMVMK